jgi:prepilin peptidase CpaA
MNSVATAIPVLVILAVAAICDWRSHRIPNVLSLGGALFALMLQWSLNGAFGLMVAALGWIACLACFIPFYAGGGMAAGDVKLMAAVGAFIGPVPGIAASIFSLVAGGLIAILTVAVVLGPVALTGTRHIEKGALRSALKQRIPYAGAIAAGTSFVLLVPTVVPPALNPFGV